MEDRKIDRSETEEERRRRQIELNRPLIALLDSWLAETEDPSPEDVELFKEFMRDIDAHRGERKLFEEYLGE
jgi:hypothetical protein